MSLLTLLKEFLTVERQWFHEKFVEFPFLGQVKQWKELLTMFSKMFVLVKF